MDTEHAAALMLLGDVTVSQPQPDVGHVEPDVDRPIRRDSLRA
jgi:hypothetical protein